MQKDNNRIFFRWVHGCSGFRLRSFCININRWSFFCGTSASFSPDGPFTCFPEVFVQWEDIVNCSMADGSNVGVHYWSQIRSSKVTVLWPDASLELLLFRNICDKLHKTSHICCFFPPMVPYLGLLSASDFRFQVLRNISAHPLWIHNS